MRFRVPEIATHSGGSSAGLGTRALASLAGRDLVHDTSNMLAASGPFGNERRVSLACSARQEEIGPVCYSPGSLAAGFTLDFEAHVAELAERKLSEVKRCWQEGEEQAASGRRPTR